MNSRHSNPHHPNAAARQGRARGRVHVVVTLLIGVVASLGIWNLLRLHERKAANEAFRQLSTVRQAAIESELDRHLAVMNTMRAFYRASQKVDREEFEVFASQVLTRYPSLQGLGWVPKIAAPDLERFQNTAEKSGFRDFQVRPYGARFASAEHQPEFYHPFLYVVSRDGRAPHVRGVDVGTEPVRYEALEQARDTGLVSISRTTDMIGRPEFDMGFVAMMPLYKSRQVAESVDQRQQDFEGVLVGAFYVESLLDNAMSGLDPARVAVQLRQLGAPDDHVGRWDPESSGQRRSSRADWAQTASFEKGGRTWEVTCRPSHGFIAAHSTREPERALALMLALTVALSFYVAGVARRGRRVEQLVAERTLELSEANAELDQKNQRLCDLTETAHRFVDDVAHEFRTPLTVVKEFASIIDDELGGPVTEEQRGYLNFIQGASDELAQMVDDFLDSSKLKHRTLRVDRRTCHVQEVFDRVRLTIQQRASVRDVKLVEQIDESLPPVFCDIEKAGRVLVNFAVNAIKFSPEGGTVTLVARHGADGDVWIDVIDHGPGLADSELEHLGQRFRQVGDPQHTSTKGFGLGLNIAKELVWLNYGQVRVQSTLGEGSTFSFSLCRAEASHVFSQFQYAMIDAQRTGPINVLSVSDTADEPLDVDSLRARIAACSHATDLILPAVEGRVLVLGPTGDQLAWKARLEKSDRLRSRLQQEDALPQLMIETLPLSPSQVVAQFALPLTTPPIPVSSETRFAA